LGNPETDIELLENEIDSMENDYQNDSFCLTRSHTCVTLSYCTMRMPPERLAVHLSHNEPVAEIAIKYLNRLSDYLLWHKCLET
jgi:cob(I)alamin adenosyltransferase